MRNSAYRRRRRYLRSRQTLWDRFITAAIVVASVVVVALVVMTLRSTP
jgi:hypothetical protein